MTKVNTLQIGVIGGGIAVAAFAIFIFFGLERPEPEQLEFKDVEFSVKSIELTNLNANETKVRVTFALTNPNPRTIILETIDYELFANGVRIAAAGIGERIAGGLVGSSGETYHIIPGGLIEVHDEVIIKKTSVNEEFWDDLQNNNVKLRIKGSYVITEPQRESGKEYTFDTNL
ncbi:MAG: hypothetical protein KatS3mg003_1830 [Candidatus Nitrosocaldaceae archaeon]|nr:MAG: hypothetical protein KatS3mg003_1830 [Candidatus Nitrosocaldaceae archaeon]